MKHILIHRSGGTLARGLLVVQSVVCSVCRLFVIRFRLFSLFVGATPHERLRPGSGCEAGSAAPNKPNKRQTEQTEQTNHRTQR